MPSSHAQNPAPNVHRIIIAGGGTGGHLFPGVAVVEALQAIDPDISFAFVGTARGIEARAIPALGHELHLLDVVGFKGRGVGGLMRALARLPASAWQAANLVRRLKPALVVSVGGYAAGPMTMVAALMGVPTALMEQNATPGLTNRLLGHVVRRAFVTFKESQSFFPATESRVFGNPVRQAILDRAHGFQYTPPMAGGSLRILVVGGSGGAASLNRDVPRLLKRLGEASPRIEVVHQAGRGRREEVLPQYEGFEGRVEVVEFIEDMGAAYQKADLVICRAGASTIAEVLALGLPALYVPFPHAADNHQEKNALAVVEAGAGLMLHDSEIASERAVRLLQGVFEHPESLGNMARQAREVARPTAASDVAHELLAIIYSSAT